MMRDVGFESGPIAQFVVDRAGNLMFANMQARTLFNLAPRDVGRPLKDLEASYKPVELRSLIDRAYSERHAISVREVAHEPAPGERRVMDVQIAPLTSSEGAVVGVGISFVDVTRYKALQEAVEVSKRDVEAAYDELQSTVEEFETTNEELQSTNEELETINDELNLRTEELNQSNMFLESILRGLDAGVVVLDGDLRVSTWNEGAEELWGLRAEEVQGRHFMNLDIGLPVETLRGPLRAVLNGGGPPAPILVESTNRRGRAFSCRVTVTPLYGEDLVRGLILFMEPAE